jgi:hypothetical protein
MVAVRRQRRTATISLGCMIDGPLLLDHRRRNPSLKMHQDEDTYPLADSSAHAPTHALCRLEAHSADLSRDPEVAANHPTTRSARRLSRDAHPPAQCSAAARP